MTENPLTDQQLDEIEQRAAAMFEHADLGNDDDQREAEHLSGTDVPALLAEVRRLRAELAPFEMLAPQQCPAGKHADWLVDSEFAHACPWCAIDRLRAATLRDAVEICDEAGAVYTSKALNEHAAGAYALMERFQRKAEEAECACDPAPHRESDGTYSHWAGCPVADAQQQADASATRTP
jgi:hypothetical protein